MSSAPGTITRFGGHAFAAGLTLPRAAAALYAEFEAVAREWLSPAAVRQTVETDGELAREELTLSFAKDLAAGVWGQGFPAPVFDGEFEVAEQRVVAEKHSRLVLTHDSRRLDGIVFNDRGPLPARIRAAYRAEVNHYKGFSSLQIVIERWVGLDWNSQQAITSIGKRNAR